MGGYLCAQQYEYVDGGSTLGQEKYAEFMATHQCPVQYGSKGCAWKRDKLVATGASESIKISIVDVDGSREHYVKIRPRSHGGVFDYIILDTNYRTIQIQNYELLNVRDPESGEISRLITFVTDQKLNQDLRYKEDRGKRMKCRYAYKHMGGDTYLPICGSAYNYYEQRTPSEPTIKVRKLVNDVEQTPDHEASNEPPFEDNEHEHDAHVVVQNSVFKGPEKTVTFLDPEDAEVGEAPIGAKRLFHEKALSSENPTKYPVSKSSTRKPPPPPPRPEAVGIRTPQSPRIPPPAPRRPRESKPTRGAPFSKPRTRTGPTPPAPKSRKRVPPPPARKPSAGQLS